MLEYHIILSEIYQHILKTLLKPKAGTSSRPTPLDLGSILTKQRSNPKKPSPSGSLAGGKPWCLGRGPKSCHALACVSPLVSQKKRSVSSRQHNKVGVLHVLYACLDCRLWCQVV
jgi:hypothetical protein